ncbi:Asp23/Gls24 family envelope stress response protein [Allofustis seminis]|uniref:Asp23/Gls24 family envelope stress response protein n=1 Tax=Allofustis seminis TaxID=166939 RepID=UPI0003792FE8|nr:Asp23/Gls24 family envelope stress response protein [Allofustis seminis]
MSVKINNSYGTVEITSDVIATVVGGAATEVFGIVGMASRHQVRDGISEILNRENYSRGVIVRQENDEVIIDVYIITQYGIKISEVSKNVQERVSYQLKSTFNLEPKSVNVFVQSVRVPAE